MSKADRHLYDEHGSYKGRISSSGPELNPEPAEVLGLILGLGLMGAGSLAFLLWCWEKVASYNTLEVPYRFVGMFYFAFFHVLIYIFAIGMAIFHLLHASPGLTHYPNLNLMAAIVGVSAYAGVLLYALYWLVRDERRAGIAALIFVGPAVFAVAWWVLSAAFSWLLAPSHG